MDLCVDCHMYYIYSFFFLESLCLKCYFSNYSQDAVGETEPTRFLQARPPGLLGSCFIINVIQEPNFEFCSAGCFNLFLL